VIELVDEAIGQGAKAMSGGAPVDGPGFFYPPTILTNVKPEMRVVAEEQFGPVLPLLRFDDIEAVLQKANDSEYGLGGSVWGPPDQAEAIAHRLDTGMVWVNEFGSLAHSQPFGGRKQSGYGVANGMPGLLEFTTPHTIVTSRKVASA
jgi:acyl-CoA reductase-like NAD-dependent aldehyde dehydrogenase